MPLSPPESNAIITIHMDTRNTQYKEHWDRRLQVERINNAANHPKTLNRGYLARFDYLKRIG